MDPNTISLRSRRQASKPDGLPPLEPLHLNCMPQTGGEIVPYDGDTPIGSEPAQGSDTEGVLYWVLMAPIRLVVYIFTSKDICTIKDTNTNKDTGIFLLEVHPSEEFLSPRVLIDEDIRRLIEEYLGLCEEPSVDLDDDIDTRRYSNLTGSAQLWYSIEEPNPQMEYPLYVGAPEPKDRNAMEPGLDGIEAHDEDVAKQLTFLSPGRQKLCNIL